MLTLKLRELKQCAEAIDVTDYNDQAWKELEKRRDILERSVCQLDNMVQPGFYS